MELISTFYSPFTKEGISDQICESFVDYNREVDLDYRIRVVDEPQCKRLYVNTINGENTLKYSNFMDDRYGDIPFSVSFNRKRNTREELYLGTAANTDTLLPVELHHKMMLFELINYKYYQLPFYVDFTNYYENGIFRSINKLKIYIPKDYANISDDLKSYISGKFITIPSGNMKLNDIEIDAGGDYKYTYNNRYNYSYGPMYPMTNRIIGESIKSINRVGSLYSRYLSKIVLQDLLGGDGAQQQIGQVNIVLIPTEDKTFKLNIIAPISPNDIKDLEINMSKKYPMDLDEIVNHLSLQDCNFNESYKKGLFLENPLAYENTWEINTIGQNISF